ncbi:recombinase family protein [Paenibacillus planticolens]|uniref:Recombinase family protein n=1 Tax=Paenibacillus planticolens TaxID=2654976 RepID=A0ABX1ZHF2_9BACL|nr:recombinase family protein [Paenibacillus planticolens]NOU99503.1 recombinase family protein [Paenibacillus planticolens]
MLCRIFSLSIVTLVYFHFISYEGRLYSEKITGTHKERPELQRLLTDLKRGDTLMVTKLDRFARTAVDGMTMVKELLRRGVRIQILNMGLLEDTPIGRAMLAVFAAMAEFERDMIVERTQEGKAVAKLKEGFKEGRPKLYTIHRLNDAMEKLFRGDSYNRVAASTGISKSTLIREVNKRKAMALSKQLVTNKMMSDNK